MLEKKIQYGFQFRDDDLGLIVNWYPKKGSIFVQKNDANIKFPSQAFEKAVILDCFNQSKTHDFEIPSSGICSDAGTHGNPGPAEFQVADLEGRILIHEELGIRTNNYAELMGILKAVEYAIEHQITTVWTDSAVSMTWINSLKLGKNVRDREEILEIAQKINSLLKNSGVVLKKWLTDRWGEIPADFGRK